LFRERVDGAEAQHARTLDVLDFAAPLLATIDVCFAPKTSGIVQAPLLAFAHDEQPVA
jgi:hypothetical protein